MERNYDLEKRKYVIGGAVIVIVLIFLIRLLSLQIMSEDYKKNADSNAFLKKIQYPSRGVIYDRNDKLLVYNQAAYDITVIMKEITELDTMDLCQTLKISPEFLRKKFRDMKDRRLNPGYSPYTNQVFLTQLSAEDCGVFQEKLFKFPGFYIQRRTIRQYTYNAGAHILGDIAEVSKSDMEKDEYYIPGDFIGKLGVERSYEKQLRGEKGIEILLRDARGRIQGNYMDGKFDKAPVAGKNLRLSLDIELQELGERLLEGKIGSIVAIEPSTGEVLCLVSSPTYDPRKMVGRNRGKNHLILARDPWKPLLNRAIMGTYPPGSTFKTSQALTFLQEGIITTQTSYPCFGGFNFRGTSCRMSRSPLATFTDSGISDFLQRIFLLGTLLHDWCPKEIRNCTKSHEHLERIYGIHGIRLSVGNRPSRRKKRIYPQCKRLRQSLPRLMEWTDHHQYFHRTR